MNYEHALKIFTKKELRALAKARKMRWYSYLNKMELSFRLFADHATICRALCSLNQLRRHGIPEPNDPSQWQKIRV